MGKLWGLIVFLFILAPALCSAYSIENLKTDFYVFEENVVVETEIDLAEKVAEIEWPIPEDAEAISVSVNGNKVNYTLEEDIVIIKSQPAFNNIDIEYITSEFIDNENFLISFAYPENINNLEFQLILPEEAVLKKPISQGDISTGSVYPKPSSTTTDGRSLIFVWQKQDLVKGDELSIFASYQLKRSYSVFIVSLVVLLLLAVATLIFVYKLKPKVKEKIIKEDTFDTHLKEDEEIIVNVLKKRENKSAEQGTIRIITGMSKATLSRLLKELEDRKVIKKEKRGKKNIIFLK